MKGRIKMQINTRNRQKLAVKIVATAMLLVSIVPALGAAPGPPPYSELAPLFSPQPQNPVANTRLPARPVRPGDIPEPRPHDPNSPVTVPLGPSQEAAGPQSSEKGQGPQKIPNEVIVKYRSHSAFLHDTAHLNIASRVLNES